MATINEARKLIYNQFILDWNNETPFTFDNREFTRPNIPWVRVTVSERVSNQDTLGRENNRKFLREGSIIIQVFVPNNSGTAESDRLSNKVRNIFEGKRLSADIWINNSDIRPVGPGDKFYQVNIESFFTYEEIK